jgi:hypothetical protein
MMKTFCIPIKVEDESDLYDRFLPSGLSFSGELVDYLTDYIEDRKTGEKICIELHADKEPDMGIPLKEREDDAEGDGEGV